MAAGTVWGLVNYVGELFTASPTQTPVLTMAGGLNGVKQTDNFEFPVSQEYSVTAAAQPSITETDTQTAATPTNTTRTQYKNVCQIHFEGVSVTYAKMSTMGRMNGIATAGTEVTPTSELDFQISVVLKKIARDVEYSILQGAYAISTSAAVASKTRGLNEAAALGTTVAAGGATLSKTLIDHLLREAWANGATFGNPVIVVNAFQKQMLSKLYGYAPTDRNVGGLNIKQIETDFGAFGITLDPFQATDTLLIADMGVVSIVTQPVPGKGNMFYEPLAKTVAAESGQLYGQIGLDHGPYFAHCSLTGLATS
jgi:hypothetical protein